MGWYRIGVTMIKLYTKGKEISQLVQTLTWSGDIKEVARKISFALIFNERDSSLPVTNIAVGDDVVMHNDKGKPLFGGVIFEIDRSASARTITYMAYDLLYYIKNSEISRIFDTTPEAITRQICDDLNIPVGNIASTGVKTYYPCLGKNTYEAIMGAYTNAGKIKGKVYIPMMQDINKLSVIEKGSYCGVVLEGTYNLIDSAYKVTLSELVNKVLITDDKGNIKSTKEDMTSMKKYGTVQKVYKQEDGKDSKVEAEALMHGLNQSGSVTSLGDVRAIAGCSIAVQESKSGLYGLFYIDSDSHTFSNGKHEMSLTLNFKNMMDEHDTSS